MLQTEPEGQVFTVCGFRRVLLDFHVIVRGARLARVEFAEQLQEFSHIFLGFLLGVLWVVGAHCVQIIPSVKA